MKFDEKLQELTEKHKGVHRNIIPELTEAVWTDKDMLTEVVDTYIRRMVAAVSYVDATENRRNGLDSAKNGVKPSPLRFGDNREDILNRQEQARQKWLKNLKNYRLFGGLRLQDASIADVAHSITARRSQLRKYTAGVNQAIQFEEFILKLAKNASVEQVVDVLNVNNEERIQEYAHVTETAF